MENETETPDMVERFEQTPLEKPRIDRAAGVLHGVRVMGIKSAHGYEYSLEAQRAVVARYEQMPLGLDHDYSSGPMTVADAWGTLFNPRVDERGTLADVKYLKSHERTEQVLEDAERDIGLFSLSAVTTRVVEKPKGIVTSFAPVRVDLVVRGATTRKLFEQQTPKPQEPEKKMELTPITKEQFEQLQSELEALKIQAAKFEQFTAAQAHAAEAVKKTEAAIDLKKFWND